MILLLIFFALTTAITLTLVSPLLHKKNRAGKTSAVLIALLLPVMAFGLYIILGVPELPGKPFAERTQDLDFVLASAMKDVQVKLDKSPSVAGYRQLAEAFYMMRHYTDAAGAYHKAVDLGDNTALTWSEMGESIALANGGMVVPEALNDFHQALKRDPKEARARFYIGLRAAQNKDFRKAVSIWKGLQKDSAPDASWSDIVSKHIEIYAKEGGFDPASIKPSKP